MTGSDITIRPATRADIPLILSLIRELAEYERLADKVVATEALLEQHLFPADSRPAAEVVIGALAGRDQGFALFFQTFSTFLARPGLYLEDLYVRPAARGCGLGGALLSHLARLAAERNCGRLEWAALDWNEPALGFYRRLGAQPLNDWIIHRLAGPTLEAAAQFTPTISAPTSPR